MLRVRRPENRRAQVARRQDGRQDDPLVRTRDRGAAWHPHPWAIAERKEGSHPTDLQHPWRRVRARAEFDDVRIHDLRHSFASGGLLVAEGLPMIGKLLGHAAAAHSVLARLPRAP